MWKLGTKQHSFGSAGDAFQFKNNMCRGQCKEASEYSGHLRHMRSLCLSCDYIIIICLKKSRSATCLQSQNNYQEFCGSYLYLCNSLIRDHHNQGLKKERGKCSQYSDYCAQACRFFFLIFFLAHVTFFGDEQKQLNLGMIYNIANEM